MWVGVRVLLLAACVLANENITVVRKTAFLGEELQLLVDNTIEYIVLFTVPPSAQRYEATRLRVNSGGGDITRPLLITARQLSGATTWQVPYFSGDTLLYEFERTLCPTDAANDTQPSDCAGNETQTLGEFTVHVGTSCVNSFLVHVTAEPVHDWKLQLDQPRPLEITLGAPSVYRYQFAEGEDSVRLVVESEDYVCAMVAVQNYTCPIAQTITEIEMSTLRMSVLRSGATQLSKTRYPNGFYVIVALTDTDTVCIGEEEDDDNWLKLWPEEEEPRVVGPARVKHITVRMQPSLSRAQYAIGASVIVIIFTLFYMVFGALIIAERWDCWWRLVKPRAVLASPSVGSIGNLAELESMADMTSPTRRRRRDSAATFDSSDNSDTDESDETEMVQPSVSPTSRQTDPTTNVPDGTNPPTSPPTSPRTSLPTSLPTRPPTNQTTNVQTNLPTNLPTDQPTNVQTNQPTNLPTDQPTDVPTNLPTDQPTDVQTNLPTNLPTDQPTDVQTNLPTSLPTEQPTDVQTTLPTSEVTATAVNGHGMISVIEVNGNRSNVEGVTVQTEQPARPFGLPARLHVAALARRRSRVLRARSDRYLYTLYTVAIFYSLPVVQFVAAFQVFLNVSGSLDLCYYNFLCAHPLGALSDFNHVFSNVGYLLLGALFMLQMRRRKMKRKREPRNEEYGIPPHYGLLSSLGASMMVVALLSASYHVCPNRLNFQFDTAFMYVLAVLSMVKIYQSRHPDINARAHATFGVLAVLIALVVWGVLGGGPLFWSLFTVVHVFTFLLLSLQIYYVGQFRLQKESLAETARSFRNNVSGKPVYVPRMLALVIANAVNWAFAIYGLISQASDIASHLLNILLGNTLLYMVFYITMKLLNGERPRWYAWVYLASAFAAWGPALYFFVSGSTSWSQTPAHSRHLNHECKVLSFYDSHDLWHMLSAVALYFTFNAMLTWDDGLAAVKREDIAVF